MGDTGIKLSLTTWGYFTSEISKDNSTTGDKSIKLTLTNTIDKYFSLRTTIGIGETVNWSLDLIVPQPVTLTIYYYNSTWHTLSSIKTASGLCKSTLSATIPSEATNVWYRVEGYNLNVDDVVYTDNWEIKIQ